MIIEKSTWDEFRQSKINLGDKYPKEDIIKAAGELLFKIEGEELSPLAKKVEDSKLLGENFSIYDFVVALDILDNNEQTISSRKK